MGYKILFIHHTDISIPIGRTWEHNLVEKLAEEHEVHVVCPYDPERHDSSFENAQLSLHTIDHGHRRIVSFIAFVVLSIAYSVVLGLRNDYDVVCTFSYSVFQGALVSTLLRTRHVCGFQVLPVDQELDFIDQSGRSPRSTLREYLWKGFGTLLEFSIARCDKLVCLTEGIAAGLGERYDVLPEKLEVVGMGVDPEEFGAVSSDQRDEEVVFTYVGTISETRNLGDVIEIVGNLEESNVAVQFVGEGPTDYVEHLEAKAERHDVSDRVTLRGYVPKDEIPTVLARTDVALSTLPKIKSYVVSFPAKTLEYMASNCIVVASDIPVHERLIDDGVNGYLYDGTREGLETTIRQLLAEPDDFAEICEAARDAATNHCWSRQAAKYERVLREAIDEQYRPRGRSTVSTPS